MTDHLRAHDAALERLRHLHPKVIDLSLGRLERLLAALGNPERRLPPVIHVAGTNGKGSTVAFLRAIGEAAGLKVHVFTSPHLVRFVERIRLAGTLITDEALSGYIGHAEAANAGAEITFFEIMMAAAFLAFADVPADLLVLEVGLGGRYDATNVIQSPAVSVIAPVDIDHREFLGDSLAAIAGEKAGIIKTGRPAVSARQAEEAAAVIEAEAAKLHAPLKSMGQEVDAWAEGGRMLVQLEDRLLDLPPPSLFGDHQFANAALAVVAALELNDPRIDEAALAKGVSSAVWPARFQRLTAGPVAARARTAGADVWLDGGHNPHAARAVAEAFRQMSARDGRPVAAIVGLLANKDAKGVFEALAAAAPKVFTIGFEAEKAADPAELARVAKAAGLQARACAGLDEALEAALVSSDPAPHVVIIGSLYLAGEVLALSPETWPT
jgi:dihydrofolate synthase/folylpolyglutamate synthase